MRIGILGGSFDPIHNGHLTLARESEKQFKLDKILFVPAHIPPHKKQGLPKAPPPARARMVELAIEGEPGWELCDLELRRPGISYTVETLRELRKIYPPPHELFFIAGADSFHEMKVWKAPEEILALSDWIVAPRPSAPLPRKLPGGFHRLKIKPLAVSASSVRVAAGKGKNVSGWVPAKVADYIKRLKIYEAKGP